MEKGAIFEWSQQTDEESELNNWKIAKVFWNKQASSFTILRRTA
jgi:hypothetical protein